ncbi:MAG TPA: oligosaccharide flippase family protein [Candidatus Binataceae bacterium]|nr:oligosaccharide flippase family protein [Candidatus Binataceae bacterium]
MAVSTSIGRRGVTRTLLATVLITLAAPAACAYAASPLSLFYRGRDNLIIDRLALDPSTHRVDALANAQCAVFHETLPSPGSEMDQLRGFVVSGGGLLVVLGKDTPPASLAALTDDNIQEGNPVEAAEGPYHAAEAEKLGAVIEYVGPRDDPLRGNISWKSAVRVFERWILNVNRGDVLVQTSDKDPVHPHTPILVRLALGHGTIYVLNVWMTEGNQAERIRSFAAMLGGVEGTRNYDFQRWPYFNWMLYDLTRSAAHVTPVEFRHWVAAPVPHGSQIVILAAIFMSLFALFAIALLFARRYSLRHPEALSHFYRPIVHEPRPSSLGAAAMPAIQMPDEPAKRSALAHRGDPRWEVVGFHRPLSGFFYNYLLSLLVMIPFNFVFTFYIERNYINPFLEARGAWGAVTQFMGFFFALLDLGTGQAMVKYFAEYRVRDPERAITYAQFFIWFHALGGVLAVTLLGIMAAVFMPETTVAFLTWFVILHTLSQFPGFTAIYTNLFRALQRFDYAQVLVVLTYVLTPLIQMGMAIYMRHWGLMHPVFGEGMGVVFGFALGGVLSNIVMGVLCSFFYHGMGFRLTTIFLAHFDKDTIKKSLVFGAKLTAGNMLSAASWGLLPVIMLAMIPNFFELNEIWLLTFTLTYPYIETGAYIFSTLMSSVSESYSSGMMHLTQRYLDQSLRWGIMIATMLGGAFIAFSDIFITGLLPPQFLRAVGVIGLMHIWRVFDFSTRLPDQVFQGVGKTGLFTVTVAIEHLGRIILSVLLISRFGFYGVFYAFTLSSLAKSLVAWPAMAKWVVKPVISVWQTLINPAVAALGNYLILDAFATYAWRGPGHTGNSWMIVLVCLFASLPIYLFISGLLGWDDMALAEFHDAAELVPYPFGVIARIAHATVAFASRLSPLHDRFPGKMVHEAAHEAQLLTAERAVLH